MPALLRQFNLICRCGGLYRTEQLEEEALPSIYQSFVFAVCRHPGMSQDALSRRLCLGKSTVTRRLAYLEENGLVERVPSESDKRVTLVYPTEKMQALLPRVREVTRTWNSAVTEDISEEELEIFHAVLAKIADKAKRLVGMEDAAEEGGDT